MVPDRKCDRNFKNYEEIHGGRNDDIYDIYIYHIYIYIYIIYIYIYIVVIDVDV